MALNTAYNRFSMLSVGKPYTTIVWPNGSIDAGTRATLLQLYSGISLPRDLTLDDILDAINSLSLKIKPTALRRPRISNEQLYEQIILLKNELRDVKRQYINRSNAGDY